MATSHLKADRRQTLTSVIVGSAGIVLGGVFLWLATRSLHPAEVATTLRQLDLNWLIAGVAIYLVSIGIRCLRWGVLLRATDNVKWRHAAEALVTGFAANFLLPGRVGELLRADYARRVFNMSRFTSLGTIVVERTFDSVLLVGALWTGVVWAFVTRVAPADTSWMLAVGAAASVLFGAALAFIFLAHCDSWAS